MKATSELSYEGRQLKRSGHTEETFAADGKVFVKKIPW